MSHFLSHFIFWLGGYCLFWKRKRAAGPSETALFKGASIREKGKMIILESNLESGFRNWPKSKHLKGQLWPPLGNVFAYSGPTPLPGQSWPPLGNVFAYSCPTPLPGQLWPPLGDVFAYSCPTPLPGQLWPLLGDVFAYSCPNCIPARRSCLGPPPGGRHRT